MSEKYISPAEREYIAKAWRNYASVAEIATHLGKSRKTIYAELRRGQDGEKLDRNQRPAYDPELAQRRFQANLRRRGKPQQAGTWISCCNATKGIYYYTTYDNHQISAVDMHKTDLNGQELARFTPVTTEQIHFMN